MLEILMGVGVHKTCGKINRKRVRQLQNKKANRIFNTIGFSPSLRPNPPSHPDKNNCIAPDEDANKLNLGDDFAKNPKGAANILQSATVTA